MAEGPVNLNAQLLRRLHFAPQRGERPFRILLRLTPADTFAHGANAKMLQSEIVAAKLSLMVGQGVHHQALACRIDMVSAFIPGLPEARKRQHHLLL